MRQRCVQLRSLGKWADSIQNELTLTTIWGVDDAVIINKPMKGDEEKNPFEILTNDLIILFWVVLLPMDGLIPLNNHSASLPHFSSTPTNIMHCQDDRCSWILWTWAFYTSRRSRLCHIAWRIRRMDNQARFKTYIHRSIFPSRSTGMASSTHRIRSRGTLTGTLSSWPQSTFPRLRPAHSVYSWIHGLSAHVLVMEGSLCSRDVGSPRSRSCGTQEEWNVHLRSKCYPQLRLVLIKKNSSPTNMWPILSCHYLEYVNWTWL